MSGRYITDVYLGHETADDVDRIARLETFLHAANTDAMSHVFAGLGVMRIATGTVKWNNASIVGTGTEMVRAFAALRSPLMGNPAPQTTLAVQARNGLGLALHATWTHDRIPDRPAMARAIRLATQRSHAYRLVAPSRETLRAPVIRVARPADSFFLELALLRTMPSSHPQRTAQFARARMAQDIVGNVVIADAIRELRALGSADRAERKLSGVRPGDADALEHQMQWFTSGRAQTRSAGLWQRIGLRSAPNLSPSRPPQLDPSDNGRSRSR